MGRYLWVSGFLLLFQVSAWGSWPKTDEAVTHFAFGGCNFQRMPQAHWKLIAKSRPQFWIWNGDAIYADPFTLPEREREFDLLKANSSYKAFVQKIPVLGVWDDHDFGPDGADGSIADKPERQRMYLEFLDEPATSPRWNREGIYGAWTMGPVGQRTKVVLLDVRYFRQAKGPDADLLGGDQWDWFEKEIKAADYEFLVVVSGTQMIPEDDDGDKWQNYPKEHKRLFEVLDLSTAPVFLISGDRHFAELSLRKTASGKAIYEATSSGLTHSTFSKTSTNKYRVGPWSPRRNFGLMNLTWDKTGLASAKVRLVDVLGKQLLSQTVLP